MEDIDKVDDLDTVNISEEPPSESCDRVSSEEADRSGDTRQEVVGACENVEGQRSLVTGDSKIVELTEESDNKQTELSDEEEQEGLEDLSSFNQGYKPFRNEESMDHVNSHVRFPPRLRSSDSMSTCSSTMDPQMVKEKIKRQLKKKHVTLEARRVRKSGEASLITKSKRETRDDIKESLSDVWY